MAAWYPTWDRYCREFFLKGYFGAFDRVYIYIFPVNYTFLPTSIFGGGVGELYTYIFIFRPYIYSDHAILRSP